MQSHKVMRVAVCYESHSGGETIATEEIIRALRDHPDIQIISKELHPLTHTDSVRFFGWIAWSIGKWGVFLWSKQSVDVVYVTTFTAGAAAAIIKPFRHVHIIWHFHGTRLPPFPEGLRGKTFVTQWIKRRVVYTLHTYLFHHADAIIVPSEQGEKILQHECRRFPLPPVALIPNGVDVRRFTPVSQKERTRIRKEYGISNDTRLIVCVGRLEKHKGLTKLFYVFANLVVSNPNTALFIAYPNVLHDSDDTYKNELERLASQLMIRDRIFWRKDVKNIEDLYVASDLVLSLSQQETYGLSILESFASGTVFMGTSVGITSFLLPKIDRRLLIEKTMKSEEIAHQINVVLHLPRFKQHKICLIGRKIAREYTWEKTAASLERTFTGFLR
jgi:glycosyltransferase involved in cell wall biosynthesis